MDERFGGNRGDEGTGTLAICKSAMDPNDAYYGYIENNIRVGQP